MPEESSITSKKPPARVRARKALVFAAGGVLTAPGAGRCRIRYQPNQMIFRQGDPSDAVFYIDHGMVRRAIVSRDGKERVIEMLGAGDFFGQGCLLGQPRRIASAVATTSSELVRIGKTAMVSIVRKQAGFSELFTRFLLSHNIQLERELIDQLFNSSEKRLARALMLLSHASRGGGFQPIIPKVSQEILAERVGTTRSRINFFHEQVQKNGIDRVRQRNTKGAPVTPGNHCA